MPAAISIFLLLVLGSVERGVCRLFDSATYTIAFAGTQCQGSFLSYNPKGRGDEVSLLSKGIGAILQAPALWQVRKKGSQVMALKAISIPGCCSPKIGYSSRCSSTTVRLNSRVDLNTLFRIVKINGTADLYEIIPKQLSNCKSVKYVLGIQPESGGGASSLSCRHSVSLVLQKNSMKGPSQGFLKPTATMIWKFTRVTAPTPRPSPPPPRLAQPPAALEKTRVVSITIITQPNGQACSSLSQEELRNITHILCGQQTNYTSTLEWPRKQTTCVGTARCLGGARQSNSNGASEHTTDLILIHTPGQNQTAKEVATSLTNAMNQTQTFYGSDFPPDTGIELIDSKIIPPAGQTSPSPSPTPSPTPVPNPTPVLSPIPTPTPTPSGGGGGGGGGSPSAAVPGVPTSVVFTANTGTSGAANGAWTAPVSNGGAAVTSYGISCTANTGATVTATAAASVCTGSVCSTGMTGLDAGSTYTCIVRATNSVGSSAYSSPSASFLAAAVPDAPTSVVFTANTGTSGAANGAWTAPVSNGGAAITSYGPSCTPNSGATVTATAAASVCTGSVCSTGMTGLDAGSTYTCIVRATNSVGSSAYSSPSASFLAATVPDAPTSVVFTANTGTSGAANGAWTAPVSNGGAVITSYGISCTPNSGATVTATAAASVCTGSVCSTGMTGLAVSSTYTCIVRATNSAGSSAYSSPSASFVVPIIPGAVWTLESQVNSQYWNAVTYGGGYYVAVAQSGTGNRVMTSTNGVSFVSQSTPADVSWFSVVYGAGKFAAVAISGTTANQIMTSDTGGSWSLQTSPEANYWRGIAYGASVFVAVADGGSQRIMISSDGVSWTGVTAPGSPQKEWRSITYGGGLFVAVAKSGSPQQVMTSATGAAGTWTLRDTPENKVWNSVTYGGGLFVAVADGDKAMTSPDGINWTYQAGALTARWFSVVYCGGTFAAVPVQNYNANFMTSLDGVTWTARDAPDAGWRGITCGPDRFVAVGSGTGEKFAFSLI